MKLRAIQKKSLFFALYINTEFPSEFSRQNLKVQWWYLIFTIGYVFIAYGENQVRGLYVTHMRWEDAFYNSVELNVCRECSLIAWEQKSNA